MEDDATRNVGGYISQMQGSSQITRTCISCGRTLDWNANVCPYCGHDYRVAQGPTPIVKSIKPPLAGALIIVAGLLAILNGFIYMSLDASDIEDMGYTPISQGDISLAEIEDLMNVCGTLQFIFGAVAIVGGAFAIMRKYFYLALVGGVFGLLGIGLLVGALLGLIGIILIALSRAEFRKAEPAIQYP